MWVEDSPPQTKAPGGDCFDAYVNNRLLSGSIAPSLVKGRSMPAHAGRYQWHEEGTEADAHSDASTVSLEGSSYAKQARKFRGWSLCRRVMALPGGLALVAIGTTCFLGSVVVALPSLNALAGLLRQGQPPSDGSNALTAYSADQTIGIRGGVLPNFEGTAAHTELTTEEGARKWGVGPSVGSVPISPSPLAPSPPTSPPPLTHGCAPGYYEVYIAAAAIPHTHLTPAAPYLPPTCEDL